jgi:phosphatidylethanolamine-binding protein (PEBP) family uncharacterized protein
MRTYELLHAGVIATALAASPLRAHSWHAETETHRIEFNEAYRAELLAEFSRERNERINPSTKGSAQAVVVSNAPGPVSMRLAALAVAGAASAPPQAVPFMAFAPRVNSRWDANSLYIESNGLPAHNMMIGITAWQQQVPLPQAYVGDNAWRIPLHPSPAKVPASIKGRFLRGAIALAANGIPIFNPQNNRGEVSQEIGELDQWGGHCGRADDYHYHAAPLHLQATVGQGQPIAYALDGYPIYGLTEPDGLSPGKLDEFNGHETAKAGYHYHASTKYPYVNGGFHGEVVEREGQVDPQPRANPVREALPPMRGAKITDFTTGADGKVRSLTYTIGNRQGAVNYADAGGGAWKFQFVSTDGSKKEETYQARERRGGGPREGGGNQPPRGGGAEVARRDGPGAPPSRGREPAEAASKFGPDAIKKPSASFVLTSPEVTNGGALPMEFTGDGSGATLPLTWKGAPAGTRGFALIMDHLAPGDVMKHYWTMWDIPATTTSLPKNVQGIGKIGTSFKGQIGYEPPHSQGPGAKTYVLTVYALSAPLQITQPPREVNRDVLIEAMKGKVLASASLDVVYTRGAAASGGAQNPPRREAGPGANDRTRPKQPGGPNDPPPPRPGQTNAGGPQGPGPGGQRKPWIQMHGTELDADHDGIITAADLAADMKRAIALYDGDKDGVITPKEIEVAGDIREGAAFAGFIYRHAVDLDADNDSRLTTEELMAAAKYIFESADRDHDGKITSAEVQAAPNAPLPVPNNTDASPFAAAVPRVSAEVAQAPGKPADAPPAAPGGPGGGKGKGKGGGGKGGPDNKGLIKPAMSDTVHINVYADNWFVMFINSELVAVDSIKFTPHNVVSLDILPEYPMTIAVMAKDNADPKTGMEYGDHIGDGGFVIKFADGTVSNASWKAKNFFKGPLNHDSANPKVEHTPIPDKWWAVDFDDSRWANAVEYTEERVNPKEPYYNADFGGAKFIWSEDLDLDNTVIFRTKIEKPGWTKRWNTKPDLDVSGAPFK